MSIVRAKAAGGPNALTREQAVSALKEYAQLYGDDFTTASFNPSLSKWRDQPHLQERYYAGRADGSPWPSLNAIKKVFGSWDAARHAAGLPANRPGPRRGANLHQPIRDQRIERVVIRTEVEDRELVRKLERATARAERAERMLAERPVRVERRSSKAKAPKAKTITKTVTKTITKRDDRAVERLRGQVADERTRRVASEDQTKAAVRDRDKALREVEKLRLSRDASAQEAKEARAEANRLSDLLSAAESRVEALRSEVAEMAEDAAGARGQVSAEVEAKVAIAERVRRAELRADQAEVKAARAEREMADQAQAITGERRKLTAAELKELRKNGPSGPKMLGDALKQLARARAGRGRLADALTEVASAALMWRDRVR